MVRPGTQEWCTARCRGANTRRHRGEGDFLLQTTSSTSLSIWSSPVKLGLGQQRKKPEATAGLDSEMVLGATTWLVSSHVLVMSVSGLEAHLHSDRLLGGTNCLLWEWRETVWKERCEGTLISWFVIKIFTQKEVSFNNCRISRRHTLQAERKWILWLLGESVFFVLILSHHLIILSSATASTIDQGAPTEPLGHLWSYTVGWPTSRCGTESCQISN